MAALTPQKVMAQIHQELGQVVFDWTESYWLDTGNRELNTVMGDPDKGLPYGRIFEVSGLESGGKSALCLTLAALAQADDAIVIWVDFENSWDDKWAAIRGLDVSKVHVIKPFLGMFSAPKVDSKTKKVVWKKETELRMSSCEEMCSVAERLIRHLKSKNTKFVMVMDSIASMQPGNKSRSRLEDHNLKSHMDLPSLLSDLFGRWVGMAQVYNVMILAINQLRQNPMAGFGDPWYTPGGNALRFYAHLRLRVIRKEKMMKSAQQIGIKGIIRNLKNKSGGLEKSEVGYKLLFQGPMEFVPAREIVKPKE